MLLFKLDSCRALVPPPPPLTFKSLLASTLSHLIGGSVTIPHALLMNPILGAVTYLAASLLVTSLPATA